jgi:ribosome-binding factor A
MPSDMRVRRLAVRIRNVLADLLHRHVSDPRLEMITITDVEVDREMAYATVHITAVDASDRKDEILRALEGARGFLRSELARRIPLRAFPQVRFRWDSSPERGARIEELLRQWREEERERKGREG